MKFLEKTWILDTSFTKFYFLNGFHKRFGPFFSSADLI